MRGVSGRVGKATRSAPQGLHANDLGRAPSLGVSVEGKEVTHRKPFGNPAGSRWSLTPPPAPPSRPPNTENHTSSMHEGVWRKIPS